MEILSFLCSFGSIVIATRTFRRKKPTTNSSPFGLNFDVFTDVDNKTELEQENKNKINEFRSKKKKKFHSSGKSMKKY